MPIWPILAFVERRYDPPQPELERKLYANCWAVTDFMQRNGLTTKTIAASRESIDRNFAFDTDSMTTLGQIFFRHASKLWMDFRPDLETAADQSRYERSLMKARKEFAKMQAATAARRTCLGRD
jgi:hypothetical protein